MAEPVTLEHIKSRCVESDDGCWLWTGHAGTAGYGLATYWAPDGVRRSMGVHQWTYLLVHGELPENVHHRCHVKICCNPEHLQGVTVREHRRMDRAKKNPAWFKRHDTCDKGHPIITTPSGQRLCRICRREWERERYIPRPPRSKCHHGHPWVPENLYTLPDGRQTCRLCQRERYKRWQQRRVKNS